MNLAKWTIVRIVFLVLSIWAAAIISSFFQMGSFSSTRLELKAFYEKEIDACAIIDLMEKKYPGKGNYTLFKVDCSPTYFPILLDEMSATDLAYFKKQSIVRKKPNTYFLQLESNGEIWNVEIRSVDKEKDRFLSKYILSFILGLFIVASFMAILNRIWKFY